ncbi:cysteine--tRNA ligase [Candidatus Dojkabacteria bacterium]|nr:cysteine--tRNA ligase [Candidatus Dojkabacteria bacterium]
MTSMEIYDSLKRSKVQFEPIKEGHVGMYVCGPTVYGPSHLGHASTYIAFDIIRRAFEYLGYKVKLVVNITDVHDDMIKQANKEGITIFELADKNIKQYMEDLAELNILPADVFPRVTEHIKEIIQMVEKLVENGYAYETDDGVYFNVAKFEGYGKLSGIKLEEGETGKRVETDKYDKEGVADFALWKKAKPGEPTWPSPWGEGRPGWHIECSVMSSKYLGMPFDIHGGALDLRFPHHENEIAQSEAATGKEFVKYWMHAGILKVDGQKMSKSLGNFINIPEILEKYDPMVLRYWRATVHYRSEINYQESTIEAAKAALGKLRGYVAGWRAAGGVGKVDSKFRSEFVKALEDDFGLPEAVAVLWKVVKSGKMSDADKLATVLDFDRVLGLGLAEFKGDEKQVTKDTKLKIDKLVKERDLARKDKDWNRADEIRGELDKMGVIIEDTDDGSVWSLK